jgi:hypothetical protein
VLVWCFFLEIRKELAMSRLALLITWFGSIVVCASFVGCQNPAESFHLSDDASLDSWSGTGGESPGTGGVTPPGTGGSVVATGGITGLGGAVGSGGIVPSGGTIGSGGVVGAGGRGGRGGTPASGGAMGGRGGTSTGRGGAAGGRGGSAGHGGGAGGASSEKILSIDFGVGGGDGASAMTATETAGVKPARRWNSAVGASGALSTTLVYADGSAATGTMVTWMSPAPPAPNTGIYSVGLTDATGDGHMMDGYLDPGMAPGYNATVTVSGLRLTGGFDVYVYFMAQLPTRVTRTHKLTIGTKSFTVSQTGASPTKFTAHVKAADMGTTGDYVVFTNVTGTSFTLTSDSVSATDGTMRAPVNGIQIVWPSGS